ncbi:MAG: DUF6151 family protein [Myxococcota bacterium]
MHPIACRCGQLKGRVDDPRGLARATCYCRDCATFVRYLGCDDQLDEAGGTELAHTNPGYVQFTEGRSNLACLRLSPRGAMRWYAKCCGTPIANTHHDPRFYFTTLISPCLVDDRADMDRLFGARRALVNTGGARSGFTLKERGKLRFLFRVGTSVIQARLTGGYRQTPFFDTALNPVCDVRVLTREERRAARPPE